MKVELAKVRRLAGTVTREQLRYIDCFVADDIGLFMPMGGPCFYALMPEHTHPAYMFVLNFNDQTVLLLDGKKIPGRPGKVFALSPDIRHQELALDAPPRYIVAMISRKFFEKQFRACTGRKPPVYRGVFFDAGESFPFLLKRFMAEAESGLPGGRAVLAALGVEICCCVIRAITGTPEANSRAEERVEVGRAIEHIHLNLDEKITIEQLASVARLSPSHFTRVFKKETGKPPMEYVAGLRLERAKKMLLARDKSVTEIALACGFGSPSYLSSCFQKEYRMTPSEYRRLPHKAPSGSDF